MSLCEIYMQIIVTIECWKIDKTIFKKKANLL